MSVTIRDMLFGAIRFAICGQPLSEEVKTALSSDDLTALFRLSEAHQLTHLVAQAMENSGISRGDADAERFATTRLTTFIRSEVMNYELETLHQLMGEMGVRYIPLKGAVLRHYYPESWMRNCCDIDFLVSPEDLPRVAEKLTTELGYEKKNGGFCSPSGVTLELHYALDGKTFMPTVGEILDEVWTDNVAPTDDGTRWEMTPEMFRLYHLIHMVKHFVYGGCGVRPFLDWYIISHRMPCDEARWSELVSRSGLESFGERVTRLSEIWFGDGEWDDASVRLADFVLRGGMFGTINNRVMISRKRYDSKWQYLRSRIFLPRESLASHHMVLLDKPWLTPFFQVRRWGEMILHGRLGSSVREWRALNNMDPQVDDTARQILKDLDRRVNAVHPPIGYFCTILLSFSINHRL